MCEHDKLHIHNPIVDWTSTAYYATLAIHHHHLPSQFVWQNYMDRAHTPAFKRRLLVDRRYEVLFFPRLGDSARISLQLFPTAVYAQLHVSFASLQASVCLVKLLPPCFFGW
ncbi:hypothetical protein CDAR_571891 [Caerostris darwini]|uniref:Uncharacterized protein n=1 Tax=Caerostris darwini TaxID=1538125 RepID=A0AAV4PU27_9ARAC|nr:hypothetical protein CDAR_571891 [Caerostris darwini]